MGMWQTKETIKELLCQLVEIPSITGSESEIAMAEYIEYRLQALAYFQIHSDYLQLHATKDGRKLVTALVKKGSKKKTVILLSHFDVVDIEDYGEWKNLAFRPKALTQNFYNNSAALPKEVTNDLDNGEWLFGRGIMDMKAGLALEMSMIESAVEEEFDGNLLLLAVPDEEANSLGMTTAADILLELAEREQLEYMACLNTEPMFTRYPGDTHHYVYTGSIGKLLPGFFCYGKETHVGEPFAGVNANFMSAVITRLMELNTDFCEHVEGEYTPPPTNLMQKDLKEGYSVQTPNSSVTLFNLLTLQRPLEDIKQHLLDIAKEAAKEIEEHIHQRSLQFSQWVDYSPKPFSVKVMTYEELRELAIKKYSLAEVEQRESYILANFQDLGDRDLSKQLVFDLTSLCKEHAPIIVLFYNPPFYPSVNSNDDSKIVRTVEKITSAAKTDYGVELENQKFFPGLSDLSYTSLNLDPDAIEALKNNMPLYDKRYELPFAALKALNIPVMNLGPLGRDPHRWTERLNVDYSFGPLHALIKQTIHELLT